MSTYFTTLLGALAHKHFMPSAHEPRPIRSKVPLRASQGSAVNFDIVPMVLANSSGALFGDVPTHHTIDAVGMFTMFGSVTYYHIYLSGMPGGFLSIGMTGDKIVETRLYRLYTEVIPATSDDWAYWMDDQGEIGQPEIRNLDADGAIPYQRSWSGGHDRINPYTPIETILSSNGQITRLHHNMMHYSRALTDKIAEHILFSAIGENSTIPGGVTVWLGIDIDLAEITVYPAADAPAFP